MEKLRCLVVDDDQLWQSVLEDLVKKTEFLQLVKVCSNAQEAVQSLISDNVDILISDVEMPEMTGVDLVKSLNKKPEIIIISSHDKYAVDAFDIDVCDFLLKPIQDYGRFLKAILKAKTNIESQNDIKPDKESIFFKIDSSLVRFNFKDIIYFEAYGDYVKVATTEGKKVIYSTLKNVDQKLPIDKFIRIHRSYIVNVNHIANIEQNNLEINKEILPISNSYKDALKAKINTL